MSVPRARVAHVPVVKCPTCDTPYVLRLSHRWGAGDGFRTEWLYQRDTGGTACRRSHPMPTGVEHPLAELETAPLRGTFARDPKASS